MKLTDKNKQHIDSLSYEQLLNSWRNNPCGDPWFQDETGTYWEGRMKALRIAGADLVGASKAVYWDDL